MPGAYETLPNLPAANETRRDGPESCLGAAERLRRMEHAVTRCLAEAEGEAPALREVMRVVCEAFGWECGRFFRLDEATGLFGFSGSWHLPGPALDRFIAYSADKTFAPGVGIVGRAGAGEPQWVPDVTRDSRVVNPSMGADHNMRAAFMFPVMAVGKPLGVLSFTSREIREPDERLLQAVRVIGSQIGQFVRRERAEEELRESETRFRSLTALSSDFFWETDVLHRISQIQHGPGHRPLVPDKGQVGKMRWELPSTHPDAAGWAAHRAMMDARLPFREFHLGRIDACGVERHLSLSGEPVFDVAGAFTGYRGVGKEITERKREEQLLIMEHAVTRCLSDAHSVSDALPSVIRIMCESLGWECGRYFQVDEKARLMRLAEAWGIPDPAIQRYIAGWRDRTSSLDSGLKARVWLTGEPLWTPEMSRHGDLVRSTLGNARDSLAFAVAAEGKVLGVLAFTSRRVREPEGRLLQAVRVIGSQIGQFAQRKQAEEVVRESEERFRSLTGLSSDWYWEQDENFRFVQMTNAIEDTPERGPRSKIGSTRWDQPALNMTEADWAAHRAVLEAHAPFYDLQLLRPTADHSPRYLSISGEPIFDRSGRFKGYRGVGKDITARVLDERLLNLEHAVTRCLSEADGTVDALQAAMQAIGESQEWQCARYFSADENAAVLRMTAAWSVPDEALERFIERSRDVTYAAGVGLIGEAWRSGEPLWSTDITTDASTRKGTALEAGMHGAFMLPVVAEGRTLGVIAFHSRRVRESDERLLRTVHAIGRQIGQFLRRGQAQQVQRESEARFRAVVDSVNEGILIYDRGLRLIGGNAAAERIIGLPLAQIIGAAGFTSLLSCVNEDGSPLLPDDRPTRVTVRTAKPVTGQLIGVRRPEGLTQWISVNTGFMHRPGESEYYGVVSTLADITTRRSAEAALRESEARFRSLTAISSDLYWEQDAQYRFVSLSGAGSRDADLDGDRLIGKRRWEQDYVNMTADDWDAHRALLDARQPFRDLELCRLDEHGEKFWVSTGGDPVFDEAGAFRGYRGIGKDITARKRDAERIGYLASHDALTALPNRDRFNETLRLALLSARRYSRTFAVLFIDLDRFKIINDTLGHAAGDQLLQEMGARLTASVRSSDVVARLGGDEFVVLVQEVKEPNQVEAVARKILAAIARPVTIQGRECAVTGSIGICMYPSDAQDELTLMKSADIAMYRAKEEGKNNFKFFSEAANNHTLERMGLEASLRRGLERNEFFLQYQPKLDLRTNEISGVEALIRWQHPERGLVSPADFIPLAEESGLIVPIGRWVLETACAQNVAWQRAGLPPLRMSVNLSAREFSAPELLDHIAGALDRSAMDPELLEIELTESMVMHDLDRASVLLARIKQMGVRLAIDDFGVGYSSLAHLKRFPIDTLKVDRSFIRDLPQDRQDMAITQAIIAMGKSLHLTVVAEGVETLEQETFLRQHDCDETQGFYFGRPMGEEQLAQLLRSHSQRRLPRPAALPADPEK